MTLIQDAGINQVLSRRLNITDTPAPAGTLAPEVMPVFSVSPPRIEEDYLRGETSYKTYSNVTSGIGLQPLFQLRNPTGSRTLIVVERVFLVQGAAGQSCYLNIQAGAALGLTQVATYGMDTRRAPNATGFNSVALCEAGGVVAPGLTAVFARYYSTFINYIPVNVILSPGWAFQCYGPAANTSFEIDIEWRERSAQPSELV